MEVGLLGPVTVPVPSGGVALGRRARALLAVLVLAKPEALPPDELAVRLWGGSVPPDPANALDGLLGQLAAVLPEGAVVRTDEGVCLRDGVVTTDAERFAHLVDQSQVASVGGDLRLAGDFLGEAVGLWRGDALDDVRVTPHLEAEAVRLEEARLGALEDRCDLALQQGRHTELVRGVRRLVDDYPTRERLWALLITALYRSGRGEEAVATYAEARERIADELGIEPGEALRQLESGVLRNGVAASGDLTPVQPRPRARIPLLSTPTFGRDELVARVGAELDDPHVRLLTLTGIGGCGKSRVATLVATAAGARFTDVVYLQVTEGALAPQLTSDVELALGCQPGGDLATSLAALEEDRRPLVVLDNLEAQIEGPDVVRRLLEASAAITVLVTSRLPLWLSGEHVMSVDPLDFPGKRADPASIAASASVQLFVDRARSADSDFRLEGHEREVARLCFKLDGLPLALELAAARVKLRSLDRIIRGLSASIASMGGAPDAGPDHHATLTSAIAWSYEHLTPAARLVCDRLALFERGFTIESVEALCPDVPGVVEAIASILDARLIRSMECRAEVRFVVLGTVRAFALARLLTHADLIRSHELLAAHLTSRAEGFASQLYGADGTLALARFEDDAPDLQRTVDWALDNGRRSIAVELVLTSVELWTAAGRHTEALQMVLRTLDHASQRSPEAARLMAAASILSHQLGDQDQAQELGRSALEVAERHGDRRSAAAARMVLGATLVIAGQTDEGVALAEAAVAEAEALDLYPLSTQALYVLAMAKGSRGDIDGERRTHEAALAVVRAGGGLARTGPPLHTLAEIALEDTDPDSARMFAEQALELAQHRLPLVRHDAALTLARTELMVGDLPAAHAQLRTAIELSDKRGYELAFCVRVGGYLAAVLGDADAGVRLFAAAQTMSPTPFAEDAPPEQDLAAALSEARAVLGEQAFRRAWTIGSSLPVASVRALLDDVLERVAEPSVGSPG